MGCSRFPVLSIFIFSVHLTVNKFFKWWLYSNCGSLVLEPTALPTVPTVPLPFSMIYFLRQDDHDASIGTNLYSFPPRCTSWWRSSCLRSACSPWSSPSTCPSGFSAGRWRHTRTSPHGRSDILKLFEPINFCNSSFYQFFSFLGPIQKIFS